MQKVIKAKTEAGFLSPSIFGKIDQCVSHSNPFTKDTKANARYQKALIKDLRVENSRLWSNKKAKLSATQILLAEISNKT